jgi:hypothetical protein
MPLVFGPSSVPPAVLEQLHRSFREDLSGLREMVEEPSGRVLDPASLRTAGDLVESTLALLELPGPRSSESLAAEVNLAYATLLAVIDLVKSHTDVPQVPHARA